MFPFFSFSSRNPKYLYCARCNKMIGAQDVSTPPYSTPASPTPVHDQNMNFQHTQNKQVPYHQERFTNFPGGDS